MSAHSYFLGYPHPVISHPSLLTLQQRMIARNIQNLFFFYRETLLPPKTANTKSYQIHCKNKLIRSAIKTLQFDPFVLPQKLNRNIRLLALA